jgi:ribose/xylose/arabinose/galactoside ABC-type transport system permease subunit
MRADIIASRATVAERIKENVLPLSILVIMAIFALTEPAFLTPDNLVGIARQVALIGIMAVCTTFVIMTGGVDLSVGPVLAIAGLVSYFALQADLPLVLVIFTGLFAGALVGFANGAIIALLQLPPIIVTLATLSITRGAALILGGPEQHLIRDEPAYSLIGAGNFLGLPSSIWIFAGGACHDHRQRATPLGVLVAAIGSSNERAAYLGGHRTGLQSPGLHDFRNRAALAGIIQSLSAPGTCNLWPLRTELDVIAAVVSAEPASWAEMVPWPAPCSASSFWVSSTMA